MSDLNWFDQKYFYGGGNGRYPTFKKVLEHLSSVEAPSIIETGCQRLPDDLGAGMSTSIFGEFLVRHGAGHLTTVDIDKSHIEFCKIYTAQYSSYITYKIMDSLKFLRGISGPIDCLYLDSLDYPIGMYAGNERMALNCQQHCLSEFLAVANIMSVGSLLLVDDNETNEGEGKPSLLKQYLATRKVSLRIEYELLSEGQQVVWRKRV